MTLDRFYPIFDSADWLERLVPLGIKLVQLRMKDVSPKVLRDHIRRAKAICAEYDCTLVINDYWRTALDEGCTYLHLGQEDLDDADMAAIKNAGLRLGISTHDKAELARALNLRPDYIALGPIYPTILKQMKWHQQGV
ncbi:MAG: thiamine phosphate synthase, partial [Yoonia sp.]